MVQALLYANCSQSGGLRSPVTASPLTMCRYRNAYTQLRDLTPTQPRIKQKSSSAHSLPQLASLSRQAGSAVQLATSSQCESTGPAAAPESTSRLPKLQKVKKRPSSHNCFTAEMDLAAAGLLRQVPNPSAETGPVTDQLPTSHSWPVRNSTTLHDQQQTTARLQQGSGGDQQQGLQQQQQRQKSGWQAAGWHKQRMTADRSGIAEELSPGAKELLILTGLLSEDQVSHVNNCSTVVSKVCNVHLIGTVACR